MLAYRNLLLFLVFLDAAKAALQDALSSNTSFRVEVNLV